MSHENVVFDVTALDQPNMGNMEYARAISNVIWRDGSTPWISKDVLSRRTEADRHLMSDLGVNRTGFIDKDYDAAMQRLNRNGRFLGHFHAEFRPTAALALYLQEQGKKVKLMTSNREFQNQWRTYGGEVVRDVAHIREIQGTTDYVRTRRLMKPPNNKPWPTLNISSNGTVLPTSAPPPGPRTPSGARTVKGPPATVSSKYITAHPPQKGPIYEAPNGKAPNATVNGKGVTWPNQAGVPSQNLPGGRGLPVGPMDNSVHPGHATGDAKFNAVRFGFQALNRGVHVINGWIQGPKVEAAWNKLKPVVQKTLEKSPELGALVMANYSKRPKYGQDHDNSMQHTETFQSLAVAYGFNEEDANDKYRYRPDGTNQRGAHQEPYNAKWLWIAPQREADVSNLSTPFPKAGLAKFVDGREVLTVLKFSRWGGGFDDRMYSTEQLSFASQARFVYLYVPGEVSYLEDGLKKTKGIEIALTSPAIVPNHELKGLYFLPVVKLDSRVNPYDALAAAVFPADNQTMQLFKDTKPTHTGGLLVTDSHLFKYVRWVKPHRLEVLKHFDQANLAGSEGAKEYGQWAARGVKDK